MTEEMIRPMTLVDYEDPKSHVPVKACSPDNGRTVKIYFTPWGIVWHADDVEVLWNDFLKDKVKSALSIDWDNIQNKPKFVTSDELEARLDKLSTPTIKWADVKDKPVIPNVEGLAKESELANYAKLSDIPKLPDLSGYALKSELPSLKEYAKLTDIPSVTNLVSQSDLNNVKATAESAVSNAEKAQSTATANTKKFADYVSKAELQSIDTSDLHKIKKPSEYSDGFSYEVKALSDLGIDLTKYDKSVQNGWIGLVKSERVSVLNTVYVTQSVRVLGSYRPSTFIRNGSDDTWYPFELLNTWS